jgi:hypothetical protein
MLDHRSRSCSASSSASNAGAEPGEFVVGGLHQALVGITGRPGHGVERRLDGGAEDLLDRVRDASDDREEGEKLADLGERGACSRWRSTGTARRRPMKT